jgi:tetratricopeptide (TPR) repeat protein
MSWWIELGYPPFEEGKGGFPRAGQVIKHYRELKMDDKGKAWTQKHLAKALGISDNTVRDIENKDVGIDFERRQFLSKLFDIPPILLGVITIEQINKILEEKGITLSSLLTPSTPVEPAKQVIVSSAVSTGHKLIVDAKEYREQLASYWKAESLGDAYGTLVDVSSRTSILYQELPHVKPRERYELHELLCGYHHFIADLLRDKQLYNEAIIHADKAVHLAKVLSPDQKALALFNRGYIFWSANRMKEALCNFKKAEQYERNLPCYLKSPIFMFSGLTRAIDAKIKKDEQGQKTALLLVDRGGNIVRTTQNWENPYFIGLSLNRYHGVKSSTLMAIGENEKAKDELKLIKNYSNVHGQVHYDISLAQAYTNLGDYSEAASLAEYSLQIAQEVNSAISIARIVTIFQQLQQSPYRNSADVARLEYLLYYKPRT